MQNGVTPEDYLQLTERGAGRVHTISLEQLRKGIYYTLGRRADSDTHLQIGNGSEVQPWISSCHATLYAKPRKDKPDAWDYYIRDGCKGDGQWKESSQGVWVGGRRILSDYELQLRPGHGGTVTVFPKIHDFTYEAILEWPVRGGPMEEGSHPTLQQYQRAIVEKDEALMERRVALDQAERIKAQLEAMAKQMIALQESARMESIELNGQLSKQNDALFKLTAIVEGEKLINAQQQKQLLESQEKLKARYEAEQAMNRELAIRRRAEKRIQLCLLALGIAMILLAAIAMSLDIEAIKEWIDVVVLLVGLIGTGWGVQAFGGDE